MSFHGFSSKRLLRLGHLPRLDSIEEPTRAICMDVISQQLPDGPHLALRP